MKNTLFLSILLACSFSAYSQECKTILSEDYSEEYGTRFYGKELSLPVVGANDTLTFFGMNSKGVGLILAFNFTPGLGKCIKQGEKVNIVFSDTTMLELKTNSEISCRGEALIFFGDMFGKEQEWKQLRTKTITSISVWHHKGPGTIQLSATEGNEVRRSLECLYETMPK